MNQTESKLDTVILVTRNGMGTTTPELQHLLAGKYFQLLLDDGKRPAAICFYADGVRLVCEGSPVLDTLRALESSGVHLIVCQTCLNTLGLVDQRRIGIVGGMGDIIEAQWQAAKVITI
ncbi:MAG: DsrE family protein [Chloroflexi bacterium]|nr:DsrE family protein [Chloroflexota bacterium]